MGNINKNKILAMTRILFMPPSNPQLTAANLK
jgi:hypothetical protein